MFATVEPWEDAWALRIPRVEMERLGLQAGDAVRVTIQRVPSDGPVNMSDGPVFQDPDPKASQRHDAHLYGGPPDAEEE